MDCLHTVMFASVLIIVFPALQGVTVCEWGKYGHNCDRLCSEHCRLHPVRNLRPCHKDTGKCFEGCVRGRHGDLCDQLCSPNCIKNSCIQRNGECTIGCIEGYSGYFCNITTGTQIQSTVHAVQGVPVCEWGKYGHNCDRLCSDQCRLHPVRNLRHCHKDTGKCSHGCVRGRHGDHCDQLCSPNCTSTTCNQGNGDCTIGCIDGYIGYFCNITTGTQIKTTGEGNITQSMQLMWLLPVAVLILSTIYCWKRRNRLCSQRCRRTCHKELIRRNPSASSNVPSQGHSQSEEDPRLSTVPYASNVPSQGHSQSEEDPRLSTVPYASSVPSQGHSRSEEDPRLSTVPYASGDPSQDLSQSERVPLRTQESDHHASSDLSWDPSQSEEDPLLSTASHATPSQADGDLFYASKFGDLEKVKRLLTTPGVDVNCRRCSRTAVMEAAWWGHRDVVELLVRKGADMSLVDEDGNNILHWTCMRGDVETVELVLSLNVVDINSRGVRSQTPVMAAARGGHRDVVELLVSKGADVSLVDDVGNNTLHWTCMRGDVDMVKFVLSQNVMDIDARNRRGQTAADLARLGGPFVQRLVELLKSRGAQ